MFFLGGLARRWLTLFVRRKVKEPEGGSLAHRLEDLLAQLLSH